MAITRRSHQDDRPVTNYHNSELRKIRHLPIPEGYIHPSLTRAVPTRPGSPRGSIYTLSEIPETASPLSQDNFPSLQITADIWVSPAQPLHSSRNLEDDTAATSTCAFPAPLRDLANSGSRSRKTASYLPTYSPPNPTSCLPNQFGQISR